MPAPRKPAKSEPTMFVATTSGSTEVDGETFPFTKGVTRVRAGHPMLKNVAEYFEPIEAHYDVEAATAAPGETR